MEAQEGSLASPGVVCLGADWHRVSLIFKAHDPQPIALKSPLPLRKKRPDLVVSWWIPATCGGEEPSLAVRHDGFHGREAVYHGSGDRHTRHCGGGRSVSVLITIQCLSGRLFQESFRKK